MFNVTGADSYATDADAMTITVTEAAGNGSWPNLCIKDATGIEKGADTSLDWCGFGYSASIDGVSVYFFVGGLHLPTANA